MRLTVTVEAAVSEIVNPDMDIQSMNGTLCSADPVVGVHITMMVEAPANAAPNTCFSLLKRLYLTALPTTLQQGSRGCSIQDKGDELAMTSWKGKPG
jgi:hypothetical protein